MLTFSLICLAVGCLVGFLAGLFGIGGGMVVVPLLVYLLPMIGMPDQLLMSVALGTSFATIIITSGASAYNHHKRGNVVWSVLKTFLPSLMISVFLASTLISNLPKEISSKIFAVLVGYMAIKMALSIKPKGEVKPFTTTSSIIGGSIIGALSSMAGIGGGGFIVPFLNSRGIEMKKAIGTSAFCGTLLATSGMLSYMHSGWNHPDLPAGSIGYIYVPAVLAITCTSFFTAKAGVAMASRLPVATLKRYFALMLIVIALRMLFE